MCYIIACAACGCLEEVARRDALTCSPRCRVWLHRHPRYLHDLRQICAQVDVDLFSFLQAKAIPALRPDLVERLRSGEIKLADVRVDVVRAFVARVMEAVRVAEVASA